MNLFLRGIPGIGKTTVIIKLSEKLKSMGYTLAGFYTEEIREEGRRVGFRTVRLDSQESSVLAHKDVNSPERVGKYGVDVNSFEEIALPSLIVTGPDETVIVDEIGKMEMFSETFKKKVKNLISLPNPFIATIPATRINFVEGLLDKEAEVLQVTKENRDSLPARILSLLG